MQQTNNDIHIKVQLGNELRRFAIQTPSFGHLETTLRKLFCLNGGMIIKYLDDENDWVSISTDTEFQHAIELTTIPLRLTIEVPSAFLEEDEEVESASEESLTPPAGRGRGRGRGRGKGNNMTAEERLNVKTDRLSKRIENLEHKIENGEIPNGRARVLLWRLEKMKHKQEFLEKQKEALADGVPIGGPGGRGRRGGPGGRGRRGGPGGRGRRGGRGRGGRGGWWRNQVDTTTSSTESDTTIADSETTFSETTSETTFSETTSETTNATTTDTSVSSSEESTPTPKKLNPNQKIRLCRQSLNAAKKSGDQQEIESCEAALEEALEEKQSKQQARKNFNEATKQHRARIQQCKTNLRIARQSGQDKEIIDSCMAALQLAKTEMQEARASLSSTQ